MTTEFKIVEEAKKPLSMNPKKFALWLFMVSAFMLFMAYISAYIVRQAQGNWVTFDLPPLFWVNTVIIVLSSFFMHGAYLAAKKDRFETVKLMVGITAILGMAFLVGQVLAWGELVAGRIHFVGNPSGSFVYVISGLHGFHIIGGVIFLLVVLVAAFRSQVHSGKLAQIEMCATYWHFLDALWVFLFIFLLFNR